VGSVLIHAEAGSAITIGGRCQLTSYLAEVTASPVIEAAGCPS
jgi:hypothetical protein